VYEVQVHSNEISWFPQTITQTLVCEVLHSSYRFEHFRFWSELSMTRIYCCFCIKIHMKEKQKNLVPNTTWFLAQILYFASWKISDDQQIAHLIATRPYYEEAFNTTCNQRYLSRYFCCWIMSIPRAFVDDKGLCAVQKISKALRELSIYLRLEAIWVIYDATKHGME
jgi:hypothetical protein